MKRAGAIAARAGRGALAAALALALAGCGVGGAPIPPDQVKPASPSASAQSGVVVSGSAEMGVAHSF